MPEDRADAELMTELRKRNPDALSSAYDRYGNIVYSVFLRITRDESAAEDLVQELFMRIWNRARDFDERKGSPGVWILSIARNMAIDHLRSADSRFAARLRPLEHAEHSRPGHGGKEAQSVIDQTRTVRTAFSSLSFNQKRVVELAYFEGLSQSEIAAKLDEPLGTVKSWMRTALVRLRSAIEGGEAR